MNRKMHNGGDREDVDAILADYMRRIDAGEQVDQDALIAAHPKLAAELRHYFSQAMALEKIVDADATADFTHVTTPGSALRVRCPHCHSPMTIAADAPLTDLNCIACGSQFNLVGDSRATCKSPSLTTLGRFELVDRLGVGGFGSVWKARDKELDRTVAIKIPRAGGMTLEEQEKFFREARAAAQLRHPNIVSVHEVGRDHDSIFIVSDFVRGVTLGDWLTGQQLTSGEAAKLCAKIADALQHAHEQGVVHRDLKPANIMIDGNNEPHIMDFGLARREVGEVTVTMDGQILGTPAYMSPEQAMGEGHTADCRSDVYSLGVILFQLLTGELHFRGNARMLIHQVVHDEPPSPRNLNSNVPRDMETISLKCLEKLPGRRYQTARDVATELRRYLSGEPILARPVSRIERGWRWAKRKPMMATSAALVVILAIVGPLAAMVIDGQRRELEVRYLERNNLISQKVQEAKRAGDTIKELRTQLDIWEGRANPWEFWPPKSDDSLRRNIATDLFNQVQSKLAVQLRDGVYRGEKAVHGNLAIAMLADALGQVAVARDCYQRARSELAELRNEKPSATYYARALAECDTKLAQLARNSDFEQAAQHLQTARSIYQELATQHSDALHQIDLLESEWASSKVKNFDSAQDHLARIAETRRKLPSMWPSDPVALYRLACSLTQNQPILLENVSDPQAGTANSPNE
jgi:hypothetical protein